MKIGYQFPSGSEKKFYEWYYRYNSKGNLIEENWKMYRYDGENSKPSITEFVRYRCEYDDNSRKIDERWYGYPGSLTSKRKFQYDSQGNVILFVNEDYKHPYLGLKTVTEYDSKGKRTEKSEFDMDDSLRWKYRYNYDSKDSLIEEIKFSPDGSIHNRTCFTYDSKGILIGAERYNSEGIIEKEFITKFDSSGKVIMKMENKYTPDGTIYLKDEYKYDSNGNKIEHVRYADYGEDGSIDLESIYRYRYDNNNREIEYLEIILTHQQKERIDRRIIYDYTFY